MAKKTIEEMEKALKAPFSGDKIQWRVGSTNRDGNGGTMLAYADKRSYEERLDEVFGCNNWSSDTNWDETGLKVTITAKYPDGTTTFHANGSGYKFDEEGRVDTDGFKGAISQAFKRAASEFGIGRYLYDLESPWVKMVKKRFYGTISLPDAFLPEAEKAGRTKIEVKYDESKYGTDGKVQEKNYSSSFDYSDAPENVRVAAAFVVSTDGFNQGKKMGSIKSDKALFWLAKNADTEEERNAAHVILSYREGK